MLRVAVPNKGTLSEPAAEILSEAGYRRRTDPKDLTVIDPVNNVEFFFLRPKDIAIYVGSGQLDFGITGRDLAAESDAPVRERLALGFGSSTFRYAAPAGRDWTVADLAGKRIATAFPNLVRKDLAANGIEATVIRLDGAVEISVQLGVADAIADVVGSGRTLGLHDLVAFGEPLCDSEAVLIERADPGDDNAAARDQLAGTRAGCGVRPAVPDAGLRLPAHRAGCGHRRHTRAGVADHRAAGRSRVGGGARTGPAPRRQRDHGRAGGHRRQGNTGLRHQVLPLLIKPVSPRALRVSVRVTFPPVRRFA